MMTKHQQVITFNQDLSWNARLMSALIATYYFAIRQLLNAMFYCCIALSVCLLVSALVSYLFKFLMGCLIVCTLLYIFIFPIVFYIK